MITKGYTADIAYIPEVSIWLDAWVWNSGRTPVPVRFTDEQGESILIGHMRPIRWWKETVRKSGGENSEFAMVLFGVSHERNPEKRMGDFCGSHHRVAFYVVEGIVVGAEIQKQ